MKLTSVHPICLHGMHRDEEYRLAFHINLPLDTELFKVSLNKLSNSAWCHRVTGEPLPQCLDLEERTEIHFQTPEKYIKVITQWHVPKQVTADTNAWTKSELVLTLQDLPHPSYHYIHWGIPWCVVAKISHVTLYGNDCVEVVWLCGFVLSSCDYGGQATRHQNYNQPYVQYFAYNMMDTVNH